MCGKLRSNAPTARTARAIYWRYELWLRESESALGSITGGNGSIYAVRREDYVTHRFGHDLGLPDAMVKRGSAPSTSRRRSPRSSRDRPRGRVPPQGAHVPVGVAAPDRGADASGVGPLYLVELLSHRVLRYAAACCTSCCSASSVVLAGEGGAYQLVLARSSAWLGLAALGRLRIRLPGAGIAYYYFLVTWATVAALVSYLRFGVSPHWERAEGVR